jgi:hypothetical protein
MRYDRSPARIIPLILMLIIPFAARGDATDSPDISAAVRSIVEQTNALRKANGLEPVISDEKLNATASDFAKFMADSGKYGHEADGHQPSDRATKHGYEFALINENIAWQSNSEGFTTEKLASGFENGWENSPGHRKNMLDPDVRDIGVGIAKASDGKYYAVQVFGRPKSEATTFYLQNRSSATIHYTVDDQAYDLKPNTRLRYTRGRPPEVRITLPGQKEPVMLNPKNEAEYVVKPAKGGKLEVSGPKDRPTTTQRSTTRPVGQTS